MPQKKGSSEDKDLVKWQRVFGATGHLALQAMEESGKFYNKLTDLMSRIIGRPEDPNPNYTEDNGEDPFILSSSQAQVLGDFNKILADYQLDVTVPISNITQVAADSFNNVLHKRREKVLNQLEKKNPKAATSIKRIPPSASTMFGGDHGRLERVVKVAKDLNSTSKNSGGNNSYRGSSSYSSKNGSSKPTYFSKYSNKKKDYASKKSGGYKSSGKGNSSRGGKN